MNWWRRFRYERDRRFYKARIELHEAEHRALETERRVRETLKRLDAEEKERSR